MKIVRGFLYLLILVLVSTSVAAQPETKTTDQVKAYKQLDKLLVKLKDEVDDIPFEVNRVATYQISYDTTLFTKSGIQLLKNEIEGVFIDNGSIEFVEPGESTNKKTLHIVGSDSSLVLRNTSEDPDKSSNKLVALSKKHGIDAFLNGHVQYKESLGYVVSLELFNPSNRSVIWSKSLISEPVGVEKPYKGKTFLISTGALNLNTVAYNISGSPYQGDILLLDYNTDITYRQSINQSNDGYIGLSTGYHYYSLTSFGEKLNSYEPISTSAFDLGVRFYKTWAEKSEQKGEYWVELFLGPDVLFIANTENALSLSQGVNFNVSENIGISLDVQYLLTPKNNLKNEDETKNLELNSFGYGVKILLRF